MNDIFIMESLSFMAAVTLSKTILTTRCSDDVKLLMERYISELYFVISLFICQENQVTIFESC